MKALKLWVCPAIIVVAWMTAAAFTLSELATANASLRSVRTAPLRGRESKQRSLAARAQPAGRLAVSAARDAGLP